MLSLGGERLPPLIPPPPPPPKKKSFGSLPVPRSWYATTIIVSCFAHLLILAYPDHHQHLRSSSLYYPGPRPKILSQSVHNFCVMSTNKQTNRQINVTKNVTSFAKEVMSFLVEDWACRVLSASFHSSYQLDDIFFHMAHIHTAIMKVKSPCTLHAGTLLHSNVQTNVKPNSLIANVRILHSPAAMAPITTTSHRKK